MRITEALGGVIRIETESSNSVLAGHRLRMDRIDAKTLAVLKNLGQSPTVEAMGELHDVMSEEIGAMVGGLKGKREVVIFDRYRISLPPAFYR